MGLSTLCHISPYFDDTFPGHVNWFPNIEATPVGVTTAPTTTTLRSCLTCKYVSFKLCWNRLSVNGRCGLRQFDSDETIDSYRKSMSGQHYRR
jgi:hypothetical protein